MKFILHDCKESESENKQSNHRLFTALSSVVCEQWPKMGGGKRKLDLEKTEENAPARKRVNLDHLNPEEQLMRRKLKSRRPDFSGQEESSDRFDREAAWRGSSLPAGEPQCQHQAPDDQRQAAEDQDQAPDGERQPSAAEQRSTSQTDAQKKFFQSPDLVSQLLPFLDLASTWSLVMTRALYICYFPFSYVRHLLGKRGTWLAVHSNQFSL